ncbi:MULTISPECIES: tail fiber assembly protein [unclassified Escherichia]|uniref:tail fiber assembly protein n=1 Tax=unclassified Escherichia TaxID=2608889 RepID=UPI000CF76A5C|nr:MULTISPECIES: tail fiber assembly protein [unclassified Escherichia]
MDKAVLNSELIATKAGNITVYNYDGETREYISESTEYLAVGVGIPAYSCLDAPGSYQSGYVSCRTLDLRSWEYVPDHRGETVYNTLNGKPMEIKTIGEYPENVTTLAPSTPYDVWNGNEWVVDLQAKKNALEKVFITERDMAINEALNYISPLQSELLLGSISERNKEILQVWLNYINELKEAVFVSDKASLLPAKPEC